MRSNPDPADFNEFPSWSLAGFPDRAADRAANTAADRAAGRTRSELARQPLSRSRMKEIARQVAG
jgi:hypothetical protein